MKVEVTGEITGLPELRALLRELPEDLQKKGFRTGMRKAAQLVRDAARMNAARYVDDPTTKENIAANITERFMSRTVKATGDVGFRVGVLGGAKTYANTKENTRKRRVGKEYATGGDKGNPGGDTWYWRFLEFGTSKMAARPFLLPALTNNTERATTVAAVEIDAAITRAVKRLRKKRKG